MINMFFSLDNPNDQRNVMIKNTIYTLIYLCAGGSVKSLGSSHVPIQTKNVIVQCTLILVIAISGCHN